MASDASFGPALPIDEVLPRLREVLADSNAVVLHAPPGAGKTTKVPLALLNAPWLQGKGLLLLEPRRIAARAAARRMAAMLGESVGVTVGFRVRGETRVSASTRIEVVTEGILTRMVLDDPGLESFAAVLFDEFHERSIHADLGLALTLQSQELLRPDLRILVMSATLDVNAISAVLRDAPVIACTGRQHSVIVRYRPDRRKLRVEDAVALAVRHALMNDEGSILAFLPGVGEIKRCQSALERFELPEGVRLFPLYGDLSAAAQDSALAPAPPGERKVVLSTSIAETSLTIDGIRIVVDGGLSRVPRFSPQSGMTRLETVRVPRSSADQRAGRAGRTTPGVCYRLWAPENDAQLPERPRPELFDADLAPLALDLAAAGVATATELRWIDEPPVAALSQARSLLHQLGALDRHGRITEHGRAMAALGLHPRLAHMVLSARTLGLGATACAIAALLEERDLFHRDAAQRDVDLRTRVGILADNTQVLASDLDRGVVRRVREQSNLWCDQLGIRRTEPLVESATGQLVALAYPDRVAQRRGAVGERYLLRNGTGAQLIDPGSLFGSGYLAIAELDGQSPNARIYLAAPLDREIVDSLFAEGIERENIIEWDASAGSVTAVCRERLGAIILKETNLREVDAGVLADVLIKALLHNDGLALAWSAEAMRLRERVAFLRFQDAAWPDLSDSALLDTTMEWLRPHLAGTRKRVDIQRLPMAKLLMNMLSWEQQRDLDVLAPTHVVVPSGSRLPIDYADPEAPRLAVRLQEMFGLADTPRIVGGTLPLTLHLLSPAHRPVQVTRDLAGFWHSSYFAVRKDLRGRYPKHEWPEDPMRAVPTRRAKPRP